MGLRSDGPGLTHLRIEAISSCPFRVLISRDPLIPELRSRGEGLGSVRSGLGTLNPKTLTLCLEC